ncbi:MAG: septum formation initiator family protein [Clostridia bacterium]|nr:septum formation initiator family protein [Clostridia bacterium]
MEGAPRKNGRKRIALIIVFAAFIIYIFYQMATLGSMIEKKTRDLETLRVQVEEQKIVNEQLERTLEQPIDAEYVERVAREKLGLAYPNERVFVNVDSN